MNTFRLFPEREQRRARERIENMLPEGVELALLSFTGSRAFGWGSERHDVDAHGFFAAGDDWFNTCHAAMVDRESDGAPVDCTIKEVQSLEDPAIDYGRWKQYYDMSNPFFVHEDFDFEGYMSECSAETVTHVFPYDINLQISRLEHQFQDRAACHTYKELMIPLYYLEEGVIETNVVEVQNEKYGCGGLTEAAESYRNGEHRDLDEGLVMGEVEDLHDRLERRLVEEGVYEP